MTLTFRDAVTVRLYLATAFALGTLAFPGLLLLLISRYMDVNTYSTVFLVAAGLWLVFFLVAVLHFDWFGTQRMGYEKSLSVSRIDCAPEYLRLTGHTGWQIHYDLQGMSLSKEAYIGRNGNVSYYLILLAGPEEQEDMFFIGYDEEQVDAILADCTPGGSSGQLGTTPEPVPWEAYLPLPAYHMAVLLFSGFIVCIDSVLVNGFWKHGHSVIFAALAFLATTGGVWLILKHLTRETGVWITETCLRVRHAHGKTVEYPYACHVFDKKLTTGQGHTAFIVQVWKHGKRIKKFQMGSNENTFLAEILFRKLTTARQKAL